MTSAKQKPETQYRVTMLVGASQVEAVAEQMGGVTVEQVQKIEPFVQGEWTQKRFDGDKYDPPALLDRWTNTDGRSIRKALRLKPGHEKKPVGERKLENVYVTSDKYGEIGWVPTLQEAERLVRPVSTIEETLAKADMIAKIMRNLDVSQSVTDVANEYLAMRRVLPSDEEFEDDADGRRKPQYHVTLTVEGSQKHTILGVAKSLFGKQLVGVDLVRHGGSRADDLLRAADLVEEAKDIVGELKGDLEEWKESLPDNFREQKEEELDSAVSQLEEIENSLDGIGWDVEFPGM